MRWLPSQRLIVAFILCLETLSPVPVRQTVEQFPSLRAHSVLLLISNAFHLGCSSVPSTGSFICSSFYRLRSAAEDYDWKYLRQNLKGFSAIEAQKAITTIALYTDGGV
jgi:hypothetical protein